MDAKYPKTPYWPWSPSIGRGDGLHTDPARFVGEAVVVTEKLDGGNTLLHAGKVYARSVSAPSEGPWMAMVKKHHAWKVSEPDVWLYGEDIYGVHSIEYGPVPEEETFHAFGLRHGDGAFASFTEVEAYASRKMIPVAPVLFRGSFRSVSEIQGFVDRAHGEPSALGGAREGVVLRLARGFPVQEFSKYVCKSVRSGHVQTDEHWTGPGDRAGLHGSPDETLAVAGAVGGASSMWRGMHDWNRSAEAQVGTDGRRTVDLPSAYLRRIARVEARPENASGADKTWVHKAHAAALRHFRSAKRR